MFKTCVLHAGCMWKGMGLYTADIFLRLGAVQKLSFKHVCTNVMRRVLLIYTTDFSSVRTYFYTVYTGLLTTNTIQINKGLIVI